MKCEVEKTRRLILRPLSNQDFEAWQEAYSGSLPAMNKWDSDPFSKKSCSKKFFQKQLKKLESLSQEDDYYRFYVFEKNTEKIVGLVDFDIFVRSSHQFANFGYRIFNRYWQKGYGTEAARKGLMIGSKQLGLNRLEAAIHLDHKASIRLAKSIGMRREGIKKRYWLENGVWVDHLIYVANPEDLGLKPNT